MCKILTSYQEEPVEPDTEPVPEEAVQVCKQSILSNNTFYANYHSLRLSRKQQLCLMM